VTEMKRMLGRLIGEDIDMAYVPNPTLGKVKADPGQIEQVLMNLAVNARDAMPTGGHLTIETHNVDFDDAYVQQHPDVRRGAFVRLAVSDSGCGMDEATQAHIFEPFFTTKGVGKGTGLGLATVYGIVKQSGGHIEVYSELGRGTTFKIYLPRIREALPAGPSSPASFVVPRGTETILLVDDEEALRRLSIMALESSGYTVLEARNGEEALQICRQHPTPIHLLLTDVVMPKMSGRELADHTQAISPKLKVLYLSGYTDDAIIRHGVLESGMPFLQKPFTPSVLNRKVREVLDS
jgi:two-component system cell cycle sensor histidine kinase/response regulator CckA